MNGYPFAHTSPIWVDERGSTAPSAAEEAANELLAALAVAERRLDAGYGGSPIPRLKERFREAREHLSALAGRADGAQPQP
jgi:TolB protein